MKGKHKIASKSIEIMPEGHEKNGNGNILDFGKQKTLHRKCDFRNDEIVKLHPQKCVLKSVFQTLQR